MDGKCHGYVIGYRFLSNFKFKKLLLLVIMGIFHKNFYSKIDMNIYIWFLVRFGKLILIFFTIFLDNVYHISRINLIVKIIKFY